MDRFVQLHLLTFYPPSNLNRDDTGKPKTATIGGTTRLRVSSQALKRAWRTSEAFVKAVQGSDRGTELLQRNNTTGVRSPQIRREICNYLIDNGFPSEKAMTISDEIGDAFGDIDDKKRKKSSDSLISSQASFMDQNEILSAFRIADEFISGSRTSLKKGEASSQILKGAGEISATDIAMFGRMLTDKTDDSKVIQNRAKFSIEASVQVAHAFTTHKSTIDDDYFTAVDDLKKSEDDLGASFIGEAGFGSGVFYSYINIDRELLLSNLGGNRDLARRAIVGLIAAAATTGPRGKSASFASFARAQYVLAERGSETPRTLAAAFVKPLPTGMDQLTGSIEALTTTRQQFANAYGETNEAAIMNVATSEGRLADILAFAISGLEDQPA